MLIRNELIRVLSLLFAKLRYVSNASALTLFVIRDRIGSYCTCRTLLHSSGIEGSVKSGRINSGDYSEINDLDNIAQRSSAH